VPPVKSASLVFSEEFNGASRDKGERRKEGGERTEDGGQKTEDGGQKNRR